MASCNLQNFGPFLSQDREIWRIWNKPFEIYGPNRAKGDNCKFELDWKDETYALNFQDRNWIENWYCITPICILRTRHILDNSDLRQRNQISDAM